MRKFPLLLVAATATLAIAGCSKKAPEELPPPPVVAEKVVEAVTPPTPTGPVPGSAEDFKANTTSDHILFDTDMSDLDDGDRAVLRSQAEWLLRYTDVRATIEGHCDERGTRDYNLALGERRANAAKNYLAALGISPDRMTTISYGKERPSALGSDASAWAQNRRAVTITVN